MDHHSADKRSKSNVPFSNRHVPDDFERNTQMGRTIHDMEAYRQKKMDESAPFFRTTRVQTCSHVMMKNGIAVAVAFPLEKTGWKNPNSYANTKRSVETQSWAR